MSEEYTIGTIALSHVRGISRKRLAPYLKEWQRVHASEITKGFWAWLAAEHPISIDWPSVMRDKQWCQENNCTILSQQHPQYPEWLRHIHDPPLALYAEGDLSLLSTTMVAIVGSRQPSPTGEQLAFRFGAALAAGGLTIVSGLAVGVDGAAHLGALSAPFGRTVAVLGSGLARIYPQRHQGLALKIRQAGVLLSEFSPQAAPLPEHFPQRNRIISGLSRGVLVVEAGLKSGSLITARLALEQKREVMALPGSIGNPLSQGTHRLIQEGAMLVTDPSEVLAMFGLNGGIRPLRDPVVQKKALSEDLQSLLQWIGFEGTSIGEIVAQSGLAVEAVSSKLAALELLGEITAVAGGYVRSLLL